MSSKDYNTAQRLLVTIGALLLVGGGIGAYAVKQSAEKKADVGSLTNAMLGRGPIDISPDLTGMWLLVVVAVIGALMVVAALAISAQRR